MATILQIVSLLIIGTIPVLFAAVQPWVWSIYGLAMIAAFILYLWTTKTPFVLPQSRPLTIMVAIFFIWTLFLCLPLPGPVLSFLSPGRSEILSRARVLTGSPPAWESIAYSSNAAFAGWVFLLCMGLFFIVIRNLCTRKRALKRIVGVMIGIGLAEAAYGLTQSLVPSMGVLWVDSVQTYLGTARGTFINRNNFAGFMEMIWPLALGMTLAMTGRVRSLKEALGSDRLNRQALMALGIIVLLLALIFTRSRAGIVSGAVGFLVFSILAKAEMKTVAGHTRWLLAGIVVLLCVYTVAIGVGPVMERFLTLRGDGNSRMDIWRDSLPVIREHPLGIGLNNYENVFPVYNQSLTADKTVVHAHNDYLQVLIETGWVGFSAIAGALLIFLVKSARRIRRIDFQKDPIRFFLGVGAFSGLVSMMVHSFFDFNLQIPANCLYFVVLIAVLSACTPTLQKPESFRAKTPRVKSTWL